MELRFKNVSKKYGEVLAVDDVTYSMETGVYGLLGDCAIIGLNQKNLTNTGV